MVHPIWHPGVLGAYAGFLFRCYSDPGFVALAGASMLQGLVLVSYIRDKMAHGLP